VAGHAPFAENDLLFTDAGFFHFFTFKLLAGNPATALQAPFSVVLSQRMATKYFGDQDPVGKTLRIKTDSTYLYQVTGVAADAPSNSSITFNFLASVSSLRAMPEVAALIKSQPVGGGSFKTYFKLQQPADTTKLQRTLQLLAAKQEAAEKETFVLTALPNIHLQANFGDFANTKYIKIFPLVAGLILILALINYMSLSTARSTIRAKEIGVRKVFGAGR
ncbi:MAG: hypothetical protein COW65_07840, partial [Cytophagales bacterium CG18_big_fil_WC_8_21_14_2_50_42_9]